MFSNNMFDIKNVSFVSHFCASIFNLKIEFKCSHIYSICKQMYINKNGKLKQHVKKNLKIRNFF